MTGHILFLAHRMPFPPDRGDKIRSHHILRHLASLAPVHVATFADDQRDLGEEAKLAAVATTYRLVERTKSLIVAGLESLVRHEPVSVRAFHHPALAEFVDRTLAEYPVDRIYMFSGQMGQYVPEGFTGRLICDFVDVDSAKFEAYALQHGLLRGWIDRREAVLLAREEARLAERADMSLLISEEEAELFRNRLPGLARGRCVVRTLRNGVDTQYFDPSAVGQEPRLARFSGPKLIFSGQMDYAPNVEAAHRAAGRILPRIRAVIPEATLHIVGRRPAPSLGALSGREGIHVWGAVDDIRPWLAGADLALIPLEIARGVQNKVLEAMAMELPVVLTAGSANGIGADNRKHLAIADSDEELAVSAAALIAHPQRGKTMGREARQLMVERFSWPAQLASLGAMIGQGAQERRVA